MSPGCFLRVNFLCMDARRRSQSIISVFLPIRALAIPRLRQTVDLPSAIAVPETRIDLSWPSIRVYSREVRSVLKLSAKGELKLSVIIGVGYSTTFFRDEGFTVSPLPIPDETSLSRKALLLL